MIKNNVIDDLTNLLVLSSENKDEAEKLNLLTEITQASEYNELKNTAFMGKIFNSTFKLSSLEEANNNELKYRKSLLTRLISFNKLLSKSLHFGNAPVLTESDLPDFTSLESVSNASNKISISPHITNYTNLSEDSPLDVFSKATVKNADDCIKLLPIFVTRGFEIDEEAIKNNIGGHSFCVDAEEIKKTQAAYIENIKSSEKVINDEKTRRHKHRLFKVSILMLCWGAYYICSVFSLFSSGFKVSFELLMFGLSIIALI